MGAATPLQTRGMLVPQNSSLGTPAPPQTVQALNPGAHPWEVPEMGPDAVTRRHFDAKRFVAAGGDLVGDILHPVIIPFEQLYRRLPEEGMFNAAVTPSNPFTFELGAFQVPKTRALLIFDIRPDIYRFSGVDPGDYVPVENRRFGSIMGFDLTVDQQRTGEVAFQIDPVPIIRTSQQAFTSNNPEAPTFNTTQQAVGQSNKFASPAGAGTGLLPQRHERYGSLSIPFTIIARSQQTVQARCIIFRPIPTPIAFVEYDIAGVLVPEQWIDNMVEASKPPMNERDEGIR
jgi:hypothetical protein